MAFQGTFDRPRGEARKVLDVKGSNLLGTKVRPPLGLAPEVYVLPMEGVIATKVRSSDSDISGYLRTEGHRRCHICPV